MNTPATPAKTFLHYRNFGIFRLVLAALVLVQHAVAALAPQPLVGLVQPLEVGSIAVLVFFALSGFVIVEAAESLYQGRAGAFLLNRFLRVFPHFLVAVAIALAVYALATRAGRPGLPHDAPFPAEQAFTLPNIAMNFLGILPLSDRFIRFNFVEIAWAVRVEMAFYLVVALSLLLVGVARSRLGARAPSLGAMLLLASLACAPLFGLAIHGRGIAMFQFLPYFVFGGALFYCVRSGSILACALALVALAGIDWHFLTQPAQHRVLGFTRDVTVQFVLLTGLLLLMGVLAYLPSRRIERADRALGDLTYPLYMHHLNVILLVFVFLPEYSLRAVGLAVLASVALAYGLHRIVDPLVDRLRTVVRGQKL